MRSRMIVVLALSMVIAACGESTETVATAGRNDGYVATTMIAVAPLESEALGAGGTDNPNDEPYDLVFFENHGVNPRVDTIDDAFSTFAVDVDTGSYTIARRWIGDGNLPDPDSVRVEEYVNYFDTGVDAPTEEIFAIVVDGGPTPFTENDRYQIVRITLQGMIVPDDDRPPANLTFVIDVSGSMDREDRLGTVKGSLALLVGSLRNDDRVGIVTYGDRGRVVLEPTLVAESDVILSAIARLAPEGATNAEEGLLLGYGMAAEAYDPDAINRVILASDGVANIGATGPESILAAARGEAADGIQLVTVGFGMGNYNDVLMEQLADDGDGFYAYVDDLEEAERLFVHGLTGTLFTIAKDTKVQVSFDPETVERWRLIGFENRAIADESFRDDTVDAGEVGAGHHVTALYEIRMAESVDEGDHLGTVSLRWLDPSNGEPTEIARDFTTSDLAAVFADAPIHFQLASVVSTFAEVLRGSYWAQHLTITDLVPHARRIAELLPGDGDVAELAELVVLASDLSG